MSDIASQIKKLTSELNSITGGKKNLLKAIFKQPPNGRTISNSIYGLKNEIEKLQEQLKKYQLEIQKFIQLDKFLENVHSLNKNDFDKLILDLMKKKNLSQGNINSIVKERMRRTKSKEKLNDIKLKLKKYSRNNANIYVKHVKHLYKNGQINSKEYITLLNFIPDNKVKKQANIRHFLKTTKAINNSNNPKKKIKKLNDPNTYNFNSMSSSRVDNSNNNSDLKQQKSITYNQNKNNTNKNVVQSFFRKKSSNVNNIMNSMAKKNNKNNK